MLQETLGLCVTIRQIEIWFFAGSYTRFIERKHCFSDWCNERSVNASAGCLKSWFELHFLNVHTNSSQCMFLSHRPNCRSDLQYDGLRGTSDSVA
jgi:hypothetical protein